ncbi:MAG: T9SS type A sorting domain-containing protein [Saprospiraceae bacterium]|nr:T9SS type A sorting domain-containing protein [Saprospiraceae bacterium]
MKYLLTIFPLILFTKLFGQDVIRLAPYGKPNCYEFMTQAYRGNIVSVIADDGIHYKIKMNKLEQIEWVIADSSQVLYSMLDSGHLIGAYSDKSYHVFVNCRSKEGELIWRRDMEVDAYSFDILEINKEEFIVAAGSGTKSNLFKMNLAGDIIWHLSLSPSVHWANSGEVIFPNEQGFLVLGEKIGLDSLYWTQIDGEGDILWQKRTYFVSGEGGVPIHQNSDGTFLIYDPYTYRDSYFNLSIPMLLLAADLEELARPEYEVRTPCEVIPFYSSPGVNEMVPYYDSLIFSVGSYSDEEDELLIYCPGVDNCLSNPIRFELPNTFECRPSSWSGNHLMLQRGVGGLIVAFAEEMEDGFYTRFCNFEFDFFNYYGHQYEINVFTSNGDCQPLNRSEMFKDWIFFGQGAGGSVLEWGRPRDFIHPFLPQTLDINASTYGYDFCIDRQADFNGGAINFLIRPSDGAGIGINLAASSDPFEGNGIVYLKYWRYGGEWQEGTSITLQTPPTFEFDDPMIERVSGTSWKVVLPQLEHFKFYQSDLAFNYDPQPSDTLVIRAHANLETNISSDLHNDRSFRISVEENDSTSVMVQNANRHVEFIESNDRILYTLTYHNQTQDTVRDLRFYNSISGAKLESFAPELSSMPVETRLIRDPLGTSLDFSVPGIKLAPEQTFFMTFSLEAANPGCGNLISNSVLTMANYQRLAPVSTSIKYHGLGMELVKDTLVAVGEDFNGIEIRRDTIITEIRSGENGCDTLIRYQINTTLVNASELSLDELKAYPNPFRHSFILEGNHALIKRLQIYDTEGREVNYHLGRGNEVFLDSGNKGIYLIRLEKKDGMINWLKVLKI